MRRVGRDGLRWSASLLLAVCAHAAAVGAGMWWGARDPRPVDADQAEALMVELASLPEAPSVPPTELPPGPPQQAQRSRPRTAPPPPEPAPAPVPDSAPDATLPASPDPPPEAETPQQEPEAKPDEETASDAVDVPETRAPPDVSAPASGRYAAERTASGVQGNEVDVWQGALLGHLERYRKYPRQAERLRQEGVAYVRFSVDREGNVDGIRIGRSSGFDSLDRETMAVVQRASPVPPPPDDIRGDPVEVMVPVSFFMRR